MGVIVAAFATSHVLGAPNGVEDQAERVFQGMREIGVRLRAARPDVLVVITSDHLNNFHVDAKTPFAIAAGATHTPFGDMGIPTTPFPGAPDFAAGFPDFAAASGIEVPALSEVRPDHGVTIPLGVADPAASIPTALLYVNPVLSPAPEPGECWRLGGALKAYAETARPAGERIALLAGGGLSHWLGVPEEGRVNSAWDEHFISQLISGDGEALSRLSNEAILAEAGNGGLEVSAWVVLAGACPGALGEKLYYEAMPTWASGMGGVALEMS